jgi:hypothetical protein
MLVHGGNAPFGWPSIPEQLLSNTLALPLSSPVAWSTLEKPPTRRDHASVYDPVGDRMIVVGGENTGGTVVPDVWSLSLADPTDVSPLPGISLRRHTAIYDAVRNRVVVFGGSDGSTLSNQVRILDLNSPTQWDVLSTAGTPPSPRFRHAAIYDPAGDRMLIFGGNEDGTSTNILKNDLWELSFSGTPTWTLLAPQGTAPAPVQYHSAAYDPVGHRMLVYAGSQLWELMLGGEPTWSLMTIPGPNPGPRSTPALVFDASRNRLLLLGGNPSDGIFWELQLSGQPAWNQLHEFDEAGGRGGASLIYDVLRDRLVMFGGDDPGPYATSGIANQLWMLDPGTVVTVPAPAVPGVLRLSAGPNPTRGRVGLALDLPAAAHARVEVWDVQGRRVAEVHDAWAPAGVLRLAWDGRDEDGRRAPAGIYLVGARVGSQRTTARIALLD